MNAVLPDQGVDLTDQWRVRIVLLVFALEVANFLVASFSDKPANVTISTVFTTTIGLVMTDGVINKKKNGDKDKEKESG